MYSTQMHGKQEAVVNTDKDVDDLQIGSCSSARGDCSSCFFFHDNAGTWRMRLFAPETFPLTFLLGAVPVCLSFKNCWKYESSRDTFLFLTRQTRLAPKTSECGL